ncbi:histone H2A deubiquitinase MYSM1-like isoform X2 [Anoplophora glabripennis]|uniref:histone H2A deubiquitinase MYSM1-like isoform X2 n=1 Tax=Anoplophora glabripennis TaxID=217634 RepID=UPI000874A3DC|nr:histone H2A deubiquitinase MYSM1-like isoform X2 [Anoplophora glabripennis]
MAEEDEIDVLGEFNLDNYLVKSDSNLSTSLVSQNTELLNCDYTIHPQWLLDKPSANPDNWYDTSSSASSLDKIQTESDSLGHVSTENSITDESGWTEKEKNLLDRGIEIFGKSNVRLSQFIGSKTSAEVKYYLKNFYLDGQNTHKNLNDGIFEELSTTNLVSDVLNDTQIPASIEEVIEAVSTAKPTVQMHKRARKRSSSNSDLCDINLKDVPRGHSLLKSNYKKKHLYNSHSKNKIQSMEFKIKTKLRMAPEMKSKGNQKIVNIQKQTSEFRRVEITTGKGLAVPICEGEEIVKIKKIEDDSDLDIEVDIEDSDEEFKIKPDTHNTALGSENLIDDQGDIKNKMEKSDFVTKQYVDLCSLNESTVIELMSMETPKCEINMDENSITELEKVIHSDFFEGRPAKTPRRYKKIRNHIIYVWISQKPIYVTKTLIRQGLKNCGDVNCIGRIHYFLEQIGAINFGCAQISYIRPLYSIIQPNPVVKDKFVKDVKIQSRPFNTLGSRPRNKRKFNNDGEGGCTLTHDELGHVINTTVVNEEPKQRLYIKKPVVQLVYCRSFTEDKPQPYKIKIHLSTMLKMDFHAHTSLTEVMGLVGGYWISSENVLIITHYEPCFNIASSATHCDMCPISQAKAADLIHGKGLDILGWFHSHPTFAPEPSHQDIETQLTLQQWIGHNKPCIGFILSPFNLSGALIASPFRCMFVDKKLNFEDQMVPYKFKVELLSEDFILKEFLGDIREVFEMDFKDAKNVKFNKPYFQNPSISYLEKYISSVRMHLAKCGTLHKMVCDNIIQGILNICKESS